MSDQPVDKPAEYIVHGPRGWIAEGDTAVSSTDAAKRFTHTGLIQYANSPGTCGKVFTINGDGSFGDAGRIADYVRSAKPPQKRVMPFPPGGKKKVPGAPMPHRGKIDWPKLDEKLKTIINRVFNKLLRREELSKAETAMMLNYDKLRAVGLKTAAKTAAEAVPVERLSDAELEAIAKDKK